jgi:V8-like Glu-specific endopeptidase
MEKIILFIFSLFIMSDNTYSKTLFSDFRKGELKITHTCGVDDKVYLDEYDDRFGVSFDWVQKYKEAVIQVDGCSGTLVDIDLVITAGHCGTIKVGDYVYFSFERGEIYESFIIIDIPEKRNFPDYQILRIAGDPGYTYTPQKISCALPALEEEVYIMGHPERRPKMLSAGAVKNVSSASLGYLADTLGGSSGSGVLNSEGELIGVHAWGSCEDEPGSMGYNGGSHIDLIAGASPIIRNLRHCQKPEVSKY